MRLTPYESFGMNDWFLIVMLVVTYFIALKLPRRFEPDVMFLLFLWGFTIAKLFDFTIGGGLYDFYDVNDSPHYDIADLVSYFLYAPFNYFFIYFYDAWSIKAKTVGLYIAAWVVIAVGTEWLSIAFKVITYKNHYTTWVSVVIYMVFYSITILFYRCIRTQ